MFDTHAFAKSLQPDFTPEQADRLTEALAKYSPEVSLDHLATKSDVEAGIERLGKEIYKAMMVQTGVTIAGLAAILALIKL